MLSLTTSEYSLSFDGSFSIAVSNASEPGSLSATLNFVLTISTQSMYAAELFFDTASSIITIPSV